MTDQTTNLNNFRKLNLANIQTMNEFLEQVELDIEADREIDVETIDEVEATYREAMNTSMVPGLLSEAARKLSDRAADVLEALYP